MGAGSSSWRFLITYLRPHRGRVLLLAVLMVVGIGLELAIPQILGSFIDTAIAGQPVRALLGLAAIFLGVAAAGQLVQLGETYVAENLALLATNRLRADLMLHCLRLDPSFHVAHTPGELIERVDGDVSALANFFSRLVAGLLSNALLLVGILVFLFAIDWRVGLAATACALVALLVVQGLRVATVPRWTVARQARAELMGYLEERLAGTEDVRANCAVAEALRGLHRRSRQLLQADVAASAWGALGGNVSTFMLALATAATLLLGAYLFARGEMTIGTVYVIFAYTQTLQRPIDAIGRRMRDMQQATASLARVSELLTLRSALVDPVDVQERPPPGALSVDLDRISFGYEAEEAVLRDVSFRLRSGEVLGVLGRTGSGKTTLTRLLFRLHDPDRGAIRLGGVDLRHAGLADFRRRIGLVTQDNQLFHATVRDNLTFFDPTVPDERVAATLADLGLGDWLAQLPRGLDTKLAPGGGDLSAGQAQLLAFGRVLLRNPDLVILDEASSRLDPATERKLERAVDRLLAGRTAIVIAHRLATVQRVDTILVLEDGRVAEYGPRAGLAADPASRFARLLRAGLDEVLV